MNKFATLLSTAVAFGSLCLAAPAHAQIANDFEATVSTAALNQPLIINFNGINDGTSYPGLTSQLTLWLTGVNGKQATFNYSILNNSSFDATVTGFGFEIDPDFQRVSLGSGSVFSKFEVNGSFPTNGLADPSVELCLINKKTCQGAGSGNDGVADGATGTGAFTLTFANNVSTFELSNFIVRYQGIDQSFVPAGSAVGIPVPGVPEPATWAMMLLGFGLAGTAIRRRRRSELARAVA